ncbi:MAG TPA: hypothetical protein VG433_15940 [Pirellulales bacterium]|nr:hypothetical protein [Pirellulales bacterium]
MACSACNQRRPVDFRHGRRLGRDDRFVVWRRPPRPAWMTKAQYEELADELVVRDMPGARAAA